MYSLPINSTLAAFTMASAASTEPISPFVSINPSASCGMPSAPRPGKTVAYAPGRIASHWKIRYAFPSHRDIWRTMVRAHLRVLVVGALGLAWLAEPGCRRTEPAAPPVATPKVTLSHDRVVAGSALEITYR